MYIYQEEKQGEHNLQLQVLKLRHTLSPHDFYQQKIQQSTYKSATEGVPLNIFIASRVISNNGRLPNIL